MPVEPFRAHLDDDLVVVIGPEKEEVRVPRLLFKDTRTVLEVIGAYMAQDSTAVLQVLAEAKRLTTDPRVGAGNLSKLSKKIIPQMLLRNNLGLIEKLLELVGGGAITKKHVEVMQFGEAAQIAAYLIDRNFESLGNLFASLEAMSTSGKPTTT